MLEKVRDKDLADVALVGVEVVDVHVLLWVPPPLPAATSCRRRSGGLAPPAVAAAATVPNHVALSKCKYTPGRELKRKGKLL